MNGDELTSGPIDYLVVEWPVGSPPTGEAFPYLVDLVDRGLIRILDLSFVEKDATETCWQSTSATSTWTATPTSPSS
jgi:hypothetical protein